LRRDGTRIAVYDAFGLPFAEAAFDAQNAGPTGLLATAAVVGAREAVVANFAGRLGTVDGGAAPHFLAIKIDAGARGKRTVARPRVVAAVFILSAELTVGPTAPQVLAALETRAVTETGIRTAVVVSLAGLAHHAAADHALAFHLGARTVIALVVAAILIRGAGLLACATNPAGDAAHLAAVFHTGHRTASAIGLAKLSGLQTRCG